MRLLIYFVAAFALTTTVVGADPFFTDTTLQSAGQIQQVVTACLIDTKQKELLVASRLGNYPNYRAIIELFQTSTNSTSANYKLLTTLTFDESEPPIAFDLTGQCGAPNKKQSLVVFFKSRLQLFDLQNSTLKLSKTVSIAPLFFTPEIGGLPYLKLVSDFNQDGTDDMIYPTLDHSGNPQLEFRQSVFTDAAKNYRLNYRLRSYLRSPPPNQPLGLAFTARQTHWFPEISHKDYNGDGRADLIFVWQDELTLFLQGNDGTFHAAPEIRQLHVLSEEDRSNPSTTATTTLAYLTQDKSVDLLTNRSSGSIADLKTETKLILRNNGTESVVPLAAADGKASGALLQDVNNDGKLDLIAAAVQTGLFASVRMLLNSTVDVRFNFYLAHADGTFNSVPDYKRELSFKFNIKTFIPYGFLPSLDGDFNGDGKRDAVYGRDQESLYIILQNDKPQRTRTESYDSSSIDLQLFPDQASYKGRFPISDLFLIDDLNSDGRSDLVFWYRDWSRNKQLLILTNR